MLLTSIYFTNAKGNYISAHITEDLADKGTVRNPTQNNPINSL